MGRPVLKKTIRCLLQNLPKNSEIIVVLPSNIKKSFEKIKNSKCKYVFCKIRGQVRQRIKGFKHAKHRFVLQLDDDIIVNKTCLSVLQKTLSTLGPNCAVSPAMFWEHNGLPIVQSSKSVAGKIFENLFGKNMQIAPGKVSRLGTNPSFEFGQKKQKIVETEWLPGGCVLHIKKNLILKNYYPFFGKAYSEDVMHSILLRKKGIRLFVNPKAKVFLRKDPPLKTVCEKSQAIVAESKARQHILKMLNLSGIYEKIYTLLLLGALPIRHFGSRFPFKATR